MEPSLRVISEPTFYFQDVAYNDYRELVCFERPACFTLHYYFGFSISRLWLFDRFAFEFRAGELVGRSNALSDFLYQEGVVTEMEFKRGENFRDFLSREVSSTTSLVTPLTTQIGSSTVVTSWTIERSTAETVDCTCLRGDDFFIRKSFPIVDIESRLYFEDERVKFHRLSIPPWMRDNDEQVSDSWVRRGLAPRFVKGLREYYVQQGQSGAKHCHAYIDSRRGDLKTFARKASEGFTNVLLVEYFWPMLFVYSPFHVFLRYVIRENVRLGPPFDYEVLNKSLVDVFLQAQQITNLAYIFGRQPNETNFRRFTTAMTGMAELHATIEAELVKNIKAEV